MASFDYQGTHYGRAMTTCRDHKPLYIADTTTAEADKAGCQLRWRICVTRSSNPIYPGGEGECWLLSLDVSTANIISRNVLI